MVVYIGEVIGLLVSIDTSLGRTGLDVIIKEQSAFSVAWLSEAMTSISV